MTSTAILFNEKWLFENSSAIESVQIGIQQSLEGKIKKRENFKTHEKFMSQQ